MQAKVVYAEHARRKHSDDAAHNQHDPQNSRQFGLALKLPHAAMFRHAINFRERQIHAGLFGICRGLGFQHRGPQLFYRLMPREAQLRFLHRRPFLLDYDVDVLAREFMNFVALRCWKPIRQAENAHQAVRFRFRIDVRFLVRRPYCVEHESQNYRVRCPQHAHLPTNNVVVVAPLARRPHAIQQPHKNQRSQHATQNHKNVLEGCQHASILPFFRAPLHRRNSRVISN
jgi:hypothetical protein